ncbi:hypothetical protein LZZ85_00235 [Terrimonas sp. NA20]|uniref:Uncharacterized protein n=1 Tax=Terrimonas ginsenosidimutans TaxID=2908004 RepID=A0ABS9KK34_9BACT|nr:hypothetical protein [Terrimonas ginsenosidimutans]MCG2612677.1 hypothetical protein [Terrimonas ginsenosidimutans]
MRKINSAQMFALLIFIGAHFLSYVSNGQLTGGSSTSDNMNISGYSYLLYTIKKGRNEKNLGNCFFYRTGNKTYIVTSASLLNDWDAINNMEVEDKTIDSAYILVPLKGSKEFARIEMNTNFTKLEHDRMNVFYKRPSCYVAEIELADTLNINTIDKLITQNYLRTNPEKISLMGFSNTSYEKNKPKTLTNLSKVKITGNVIDTIGSPIVWQPGNHVDSNHYAIHIDSQFNNVTTSGSPVFLRYGNSIVWGGMISHGEGSDILFAIKPAYILKAIATTKHRPFYINKKTKVTPAKVQTFKRQK